MGLMYDHNAFDQWYEGAESGSTTESATNAAPGSELQSVPLEAPSSPDVQIVGVVD